MARSVYYRNRHPSSIVYSPNFFNWWRNSRPRRKLLGDICNNLETTKIFVRDIFLEKGTKVLVNEPRIGIGIISNINKLYTEVEGKGIAYIYSTLGQVGKTKNIELIGLGEDVKGEWNSNVILLGAQAQKHFDFYKYMKNVAFKMDNKNIYSTKTNEIIIREEGFGYGIILKSENPFKTGPKKGIAFLIGGFGVLGTVAAAYYFREHFNQLGKEFGSDCFGIVVRAPITAGEEAVERLFQHDIRFRQKRITFPILKLLIKPNRDSNIPKEPTKEDEKNQEAKSGILVVYQEAVPVESIDGSLVQPTGIKLKGTATQYNPTSGSAAESEDSD